MPVNSYDVVRYPTFPRQQMHPDRLAAVATLFGLRPAPVNGCRVLEIGCGDGGNLIPMAYYLPRSRFVGVDLAAEPVSAGRQTIAELGLENAELQAADLREIGPGWGEFDYIVAHGVYSWVPEEVREALLAVCRERLAPAGIAFVSYNTLPGGHVQQMLREMMLHAIRGENDPRERTRAARAFLERLRRKPLLNAAWQGLMDYETKVLLDKSEQVLCHDDLETFHQRFYFRQFVAAAQRYGLEYVGEAEPHEMFDPYGALEGFEGDFLAREQELDFFKARRFRQTLLCRPEQRPGREIAPPQMRGFLFAADVREEDERIAGLRGARIRKSDREAAQVARAIGEVYPLPAAFEELIPYAGSEERLCQIVFGMALSGFADLHVYDFPCQEEVTERPRANRLVRYQAARSQLVASVAHFMVSLDDVGRRLVELADGSHTVEEIAGGLGVEDAEEFVPPCLEWLASRGLLDG